MLRIKFFHTPKNKKFNYAPLYYNPEEEERKKRQERLTGKAGPGESIRGKFTERRKKQRKSSRVSNTRAFVIIILLTLLAYYLFFDKIPFLDLF
jgi:hypothetical protein